MNKPELLILNSIRLVYNFIKIWMPLDLQTIDKYIINKRWVWLACALKIFVNILF